MFDTNLRSKTSGTVHFTAPAGFISEFKEQIDQLTSQMNVVLNNTSKVFTVVPKPFRRRSSVPSNKSFYWYHQHFGTEVRRKRSPCKNSKQTVQET